MTRLQRKTLEELAIAGDLSGAEREALLCVLCEHLDLVMACKVGLVGLAPAAHQAHALISTTIDKAQGKEARP